MPFLSSWSLLQVQQWLPVCVLVQECGMLVDFSVIRGTCLGKGRDENFWFRLGFIRAHTHIHRDLAPQASLSSRQMAPSGKYVSSILCLLSLLLIWTQYAQRQKYPLLSTHTHKICTHTWAYTYT